jgi:hypothetical protein
MGLLVPGRSSRGVRDPCLLLVSKQRDYKTTAPKAPKQSARSPSPTNALAPRSPGADESLLESALEAGLRSPDAFTLRRSARCCWLATEARMPTRSPALWAAIPGRCAMPSTPSTRRGFRRRFGKAPNVRTPFTGPSPGSRTGRGFAGAFASQTHEVRQRDESVDAGSRR